jgi:3-isopropylmalate/(R)-2-methylmalate dehydratase small subunit
MQAVKRVRSKTVVIAASNVDTDQIIPARFLTTTTKEGLGKQLFADWRYGSDGEPKADFILNRPEAEGAKILVAGRNFGCGSSREHAVWALMDYGFRVVISSRFGDIFRGNAGKAGLLAAEVAQDDVELLWKLIEGSPGLEITVNLQDRNVAAGTVLVPFKIDDYTAWRLMEGLDDIALTLRKRDHIEVFETARPAWKPQTLPTS